MNHTVKIEQLKALRLENARSDWQALRFAIRQRVAADYDGTPAIKRATYVDEIERKYHKMVAHLRMALINPNPWSNTIANTLYNAYVQAVKALCEHGESHEETKAAYNAYEAIHESQFKLIEDNLKDHP